MNGTSQISYHSLSNGNHDKDRKQEDGLEEQENGNHDEKKYSPKAKLGKCSSLNVLYLLSLPRCRMLLLVLVFSVLAFEMMFSNKSIQTIKYQGIVNTMNTIIQSSKDTEQEQSTTIEAQSMPSSRYPIAKKWEIDNETDERKVGKEEVVKDIDNVENENGPLGLLDKNPFSLHPKICVDSSNIRTASVFITRTLNRFGDGVFDYVWPKTNCDPSWPLIKMMYQKEIVGLSASKLEATINSADLFIVHGDEYCRCPVEICGGKAHARQYFSRKYSNYIDENTSMLKSLDATSSVGMYLPLGPRYEFKPLDPDEAFARTWENKKRKYLFNLIISPTSASRKKLAALLNSEEMKSQIDSLGKTFIHVTPAFANNASEAKGFIKPEEYQEILLNSAFTLCPAGHNPEAYRIFEACESGSIPILSLDDEYKSHACQDAFAPFIESKAPFIFVESWNQLPKVLSAMTPEKVTKMQLELRKWYKKFWTDISDEFECSLQDRFVQRASASGVDIQGDLRSGCDDSQSAETPKKFATTPNAIPQGSDDSVVQIATLSTEKVHRRVKIGKGIPLITGCGRTGTLSVAEFLSSIGISSIHEGIKLNTVSVSWLYAATIPGSTTKRYPFESIASWRTRSTRMKLFKSRPVFSPVIHVVRHPLKVISSTRRCFCGKGTRSTILGRNSDRKSWAFVDQYIKMPYDNLPVSSTVRSMVYWLEWNNLISKNFPDSKLFKIEDLNPVELVKALGFASYFDISELPTRIPKAPGHVSKIKDESLPDLTWEDLFEADKDIAQKIKDLAIKYGYND